MQVRSKELQNATLEHSAILLTSTKLPLVFKTFDLSIFEWPLKMGFNVNPLSAIQNKSCMLLVSAEMFWKPFQLTA